MKSAFLFFALTAFSLTWGSPSISEETKKAPSPILTLTAKKLRVTPPAHHHINAEAPSFYTLRGTRFRSEPVAKSSQAIDFEVRTDKTAVFDVTVYLCDDAKTFCEKHTVPFHFDPSLSPATPTTPPVLPKTPEKSPKANTLQNVHKDWFSDAELALNTARQKKRPLLIDFYGIWCPPCNELDAHVFSSPAFKAEARHFILLRLDADHPGSWPLKSKFKVSGYPTLVFANYEGEELFRLVGSRSTDDFVSAMKRAHLHKNDSVTVLEKRALKGDAAAAHLLGTLFLERKEIETALGWFAKAKPSPEALAAKIAQIKNQPSTEESSAALLALLREGISKFPNQPLALEWIDEVTGFLKESKRPADVEEAKSFERQKLVVLDSLLSKPSLYLKGTEYSRGDLLTLKAEALSAVGQSPDSVWREAQTFFNSRRKTAQTLGQYDRGNALNEAYCFRQLKEFDKAKSIYSELKSRFPNEFTFAYAEAQLERSRGNNLEALRLAELARGFAYQDNLLRVAKLEAELLLVLERRAEAKSRIETTLKTLDYPKNLPADKTIRTHRYYQALTSLKLD